MSKESELIKQLSQDNIEFYLIGRKHGMAQVFSELTEGKTTKSKEQVDFESKAGIIQTAQRITRQEKKRKDEEKRLKESDKL